MVNRKRKYESGAATAYLGRNAALKRLQVSLPDFRRLCILKGIYPHEPNNKKKAGKGSTAPKTYYLAKDIRFLLHEPVLNKFRDFKAFMKKVRRARNRQEKDSVERLFDNKPIYNLDHIVKERYPTFADALRDLDDCISMCFLFATFPKSKQTPFYFIHMCKRLTVEFMHYVITSRSLRKVFVSIKGIYLQADIMGETVTWVVPHKRGYTAPTDVDFRIMGTFVQFYITLLGFVNFKLFHTLGLHYPPQLKLDGEDKMSEEEIQQMCDESDLQDERLGALTQSLQSVVSAPEEQEVQLDTFPTAEGEDPDAVEEAKLEAEKLAAFQKLFSKLKFFLNREVPREMITFCIRSLGGQVSWDSTVAVGYSYPETDETITHQIVDRPKLANQYLSRYYVQPQWVFDCINARRLIPVEDYFPGAVLPPHLSPFVEEKEGDYVPPEKRALMGQLDTTTSTESDAESEEEPEAEIEEEEEEEEDEEEQLDDELDEQGEKELLAAERLHAQARQKRKMAEESGSDEEEEQQTKRSKVDSKQNRKSQMAVKKGTPEKDERHKQLKKQTDEEKKLKEMMIPKKKRNLYNKMVYGQKRKAKEAKVLEEKRDKYDKEQKRLKKKAKKMTS